MYRLERNEVVESKYPYLWTLLAFQAGHINTLGFLISGRYVSHITGFGTAMGHAVFGQDFDLALLLLSFPASFVFGSFVSSFFTVARLERNKMPAYTLIAGLLPFILFTATLIGLAGVYTPMGEVDLQAHDYALVLVLAFTTGMQNGCFTVLTKGIIRTTHMTGTGTDFGVDLARLLFGRLETKERTITSRLNKVRFSMFAAFALGAIVAGTVSSEVGHGALLVPLATSLIVFFIIQKVQRKIHVRVRRATPLQERIATK